MKKQVASIMLALTATVSLAQEPNWDGRRGGGSIQFPRHERSSSSGRETRSTRDAEVYETYAAPEPPNPLPHLTNQYRSLRGWFRADVFPDAPSIVEPTNLSELFRALAYLKDFSDSKLRSLRYRKSDLEERHRNLQSQIASNNDVGAALQREAFSVDTELQQTNSKTRETEAQLASQESLLKQLQAITQKLREEVVSAKSDMFAALYDAARRGKLLPPSNYRALPKPLSPVYSQLGEQSQPRALEPFTVTPIQPASLVPAQAVRAMPVIAPMRAQPIRVNPVSEGEVQQKLREINSALPLINQAYQEVNEAFRRVNQLEQSASASEYSVRLSRERLESLRSLNSTAASELSTARAKLSDVVAAYQTQREKLPVQLFEHALIKYYKNRVQKFIGTNFPDVNEVSEVGKTVNTTMLGRFAKVMSHVVELGTDTLKVIERVPGALADSVEDPAALQTALDNVVDRFNVNLVSDMTGVPKPLVKYFQRRKIP